MRSWPARSAVALAIALTTGFGVDAGFAQADRSVPFPTHAIKIVVPFPAGGPTDINIRIITQRMGEDWREAGVIENRPGANTATGAPAATGAEPNRHHR